MSHIGVAALTEVQTTELHDVEVERRAIGPTEGLWGESHGPEPADAQKR